MVSTLGAVGGAVWRRGEEGQLELAGEVNLQATGLLDDAAYQARHERLLERVLATGRSAIINQREEAGPSDGAAPKELLLVFGPLKSEADTDGLLEIFQCPTGEAEKQKDLLRAVLEACEAAAEYHSSQDARCRSERSEESRSRDGARDAEETLRSAQGDSHAPGAVARVTMAPSETPSGASSKPSPGPSTPASTRATPPTPSPTKAGG